MTITYIDATQPFCDVPAKVALAISKSGKFVFLILLISLILLFLFNRRRAPIYQSVEILAVKLVVVSSNSSSANILSDI